MATAPDPTFAPSNGIEICYEDLGDPHGLPLLLIMGFTAQLTAWPDDFCKLLGDRGFRVIRFDNRDSGLSTLMEGTVDLAGIFTGAPVTAIYSLGDMAADAAGLLDHLRIAAAHIVGASMGGMIAQRFALDFTAKTLSLCSIMSTTGAPGIGQPSDAAAAALLGPAATTRDEAIAAGIAGAKVIGSPAYPAPDEEIAERSGAGYDRSFRPAGSARQLGAILTQEDRTEALHELRVPTLVIHGADDALVNVSGGHATAAAVPDAEMVEIPGMGHDLPAALYEQIVDAIADNAAR